MINVPELSTSNATTTTLTSKPPKTNPRTYLDHNPHLCDIFIFLGNMNSCTTMFVVFT